MDTWRQINSDEIREFRRRARNNLATQPGYRYEYDTAHRRGLEHVEPNADGTVTLDAPQREKIREARDTVEIAAKEMIAWITEDRTQFMHRVRMLKQMGNFQHLTDEQAADTLWKLCHEVAMKDAERVYARDYAGQTHAPRLVSA